MGRSNKKHQAAFGSRIGNYSWRWNLVRNGSDAAPVEGLNPAGLHWCGNAPNTRILYTVPVFSPNNPQNHNEPADFRRYWASFVKKVWRGAHFDRARAGHVALHSALHPNEPKGSRSDYQLARVGPTFKNARSACKGSRRFIIKIISLKPGHIDNRNNHSPWIFTCARSSVPGVTLWHFSRRTSMWQLLVLTPLTWSDACLIDVSGGRCE